jgi:hypothetical protein
VTAVAEVDIPVNIDAEGRVSALGPAVLSEFAQAAGLDDLLGAGSRERKPESSAGHAAPAPASAPASSPISPAAPVPTIPADLLLVVVKQLDTITSALLKVEPEAADTLKPVAEGFQPILQHYAGQTNNVNVLWMVAVISLLGWASLKYQKYQQLVGARAPTVEG